MKNITVTRWTTADGIQDRLYLDRLTGFKNRPSERMGHIDMKTGELVAAHRFHTRAIESILYADGTSVEQLLAEYAPKPAAEGVPAPPTVAALAAAALAAKPNDPHLADYLAGCPLVVDGHMLTGEDIAEAMNVITLDNATLAAMGETRRQGFSSVVRRMWQARIERAEDAAAAAIGEGR